MRTNIDIDDRLLAEAMDIMGVSTKKAAVEEALRRTIAQHQRLAAWNDMAGLGWEGDLDAMREGREIEMLPSCCKGRGTTCMPPGSGETYPASPPPAWSI